MNEECLGWFWFVTAFVW